MLSLSLVHFRGEGVPKDRVEAYKWANLSAANGNEKGAEFRAVLEKEMTSPEIERGLTLSRECFGNNYQGC
jgi:TPR repeat protein